MQGSVRQRGAQWSYRIDLGDDPTTGRRRQLERGGFATKRMAQKALREALTELDRGEFVEASAKPLAEYLGEWLKGERLRLRPGAFDATKGHVDSYIAPRLGHVTLKALTRPMVRGFYADLREAGRVRGGGPLSAKTVYNVHRTLSRALEAAVEDRLIPRNPAKRGFSAPDSPVQATWTARQLREFLEGMADDRLYALWRVAVTTGLRRGELAGLRWNDVQLEAGRLAVVQQLAKGAGTVSAGPTKTKRSRRPVPLDARTVEALRAHRARQDDERATWGEAYDPHGLVFCLENGTPLHPDAVTKRLRRHARRLGLPWIGLHGLRHSYATLLLEAGVHPKIVQERLGHSSITVTMDIYSHVIPSLQGEAADLGAALVDAEEPLEADEARDLDDDHSTDEPKEGEAA